MADTHRTMQSPCVSQRTICRLHRAIETGMLRMDTGVIRGPETPLDDDCGNGRVSGHRFADPHAFRVGVLAPRALRKRRAAFRCEAGRSWVEMSRELMNDLQTALAEIRAQGL